MVVESVFSVPGLGSLLVSSIFARDYLVVQAIALILALGVIATNFTVDISRSPSTPGFSHDGAGATLHRRLGAPSLLAYVGGALCLFWLVVALAAPWLAPYDPIAQDLKATLQPPNAVHLLGTDNFGRDILSRIIWGTRLDLQMGVFGVFFPFVIGTTIGVASGYLGGIVDVLLMRLLDVTIPFPSSCSSSPSSPCSGPG